MPEALSRKLILDTVKKQYPEMSNLSDDDILTFVGKTQPNVIRHLVEAGDKDASKYYPSDEQVNKDVSEAPKKISQLFPQDAAQFKDYNPGKTVYTNVNPNPLQRDFTQVPLTIPPLPTGTGNDSSDWSGGSSHAAQTQIEQPSPAIPIVKDVPHVVDPKNAKIATISDMLKQLPAEAIRPFIEAQNKLIANRKLAVTQSQPQVQVQSQSPVPSQVIPQTIIPAIPQTAHEVIPQTSDLQSKIKLARDKQVSDDDILTYLKNSKLLDPDKVSLAQSKGISSKDILDYFSQPKVNVENISKPIIAPPSNLSEARPYISGAGGAAATGIFSELGPAAPVLGSATMAAIDAVLRRSTGEKPTAPLTELTTGSYKPSGNYPLDILQETAEGGAVNEAAGKALSYLPNAGFNAIKNIVKESDSSAGGIQGGIADLRDKFLKTFPSFNQDVGKGSVVGNKSLLELDPTAAQITKNPMIKMLEDNLGHSSKQAAIDNSGSLIKDEGERFVQQFTGDPNLTLKQPFQLANKIQQETRSQFFQSTLESTKRGDAAKLIANANLVKIPVRDPVTGQMMTPRIVAGPINMTNTVKAAQDLLDEINKPLIKPDPNSPLISALKSIIDGTNTKVDKLTGAVTSEPISFGDAWATKQVSDRIGYGSPTSDVNIQDSRFKAISAAINKDIDASLPQWKNQGDKASQLWNEAKQISQNRNLLFTPGGSGAASSEKILNIRDIKTPINEINATIDDPKELKRAILSGNIQLPNGVRTGSFNVPIQDAQTLALNKTTPAFDYLKSNTRKDLQGYEIMRLLNEAQSQDVTDPTKTIFDGKKLQQLWNDPNKTESYKILFSQQNRADISQFFKNVAETQQKVGDNSNYLKLRLGVSAATLGAGLAESMVTGALPGRSAVAGGAIIGLAVGGHQLAKLLTNPDSARLMVAMAQGGPLNMSIGMAGRILANVLRTQPITLNYSDGNSIQGKFDADGKFTIPIQKSQTPVSIGLKK